MKKIDIGAAIRNVAEESIFKGRVFYNSPIYWDGSTEPDMPVLGAARNYDDGLDVASYLYYSRRGIYGKKVYSSWIVSQALWRRTSFAPKDLFDPKSPLQDEVRAVVSEWIRPRYAGVCLDNVECFFRMLNDYRKDFLDRAKNYGLQDDEVEETFIMLFNYLKGMANISGSTCCSSDVIRLATAADDNRETLEEWLDVLSLEDDVEVGSIYLWSMYKRACIGVRYEDEDLDTALEGDIRVWEPGTFPSDAVWSHISPGSEVCLSHESSEEDGRLVERGNAAYASWCRGGTDGHSLCLVGPYEGRTSGLVSLSFTVKSLEEAFALLKSPLFSPVVREGALESIESSLGKGEQDEQEEQDRLYAEMVSDSNPLVRMIAPTVRERR